MATRPPKRHPGTSLSEELCRRGRAQVGSFSSDVAVPVPSTVNQHAEERQDSPAQHSLVAGISSCMRIPHSQDVASAAIVRCPIIVPRCSKTAESQTTCCAQAPKEVWRDAEERLGSASRHGFGCPPSHHPHDEGSESSAPCLHCPVAVRSCILGGARVMYNGFEPALLYRARFHISENSLNAPWRFAGNATAWRSTLPTTMHDNRDSRLHQVRWLGQKVARHSYCEVWMRCGVLLFISYEQQVPSGL